MEHFLKCLWRYYSLCVSHQPPKAGVINPYLLVKENEAFHLPDAWKPAEGFSGSKGQGTCTAHVCSLGLREASPVHRRDRPLSHGPSSPKDLALRRRGWGIERLSLQISPAFVRSHVTHQGPGKALKGIQAPQAQALFC